MSKPYFRQQKFNFLKKSVKIVDRQTRISTFVCFQFQYFRNRQVRYGTTKTQTV